MEYLIFHNLDNKFINILINESYKSDKSVLQHYCDRDTSDDKFRYRNVVI